jgi:hypothetical protein
VAEETLLVFVFGATAMALKVPPELKESVPVYWVEDVVGVLPLVV